MRLIYQFTLQLKIGIKYHENSFLTEEQHNEYHNNHPSIMLNKFTHIRATVGIDIRIVKNHK